MTPYQKIITFLNEKKIDFQEFRHQPVFTSEQAYQVRNLPESVGAKSLLLRLKYPKNDKYLLAVIPGQSRLDNKKVRELFKVKDFSFANPEKVLELVGCEIGAVYPIASVPDLDLVMDQSIANNQLMAFNPGRHDRTIILKVQDYLALEQPKLVDLIKI